MIAPAGQSTARAGLRSKLAALVVRRQAGPATKGLHAPWIPKEEVAEGAGYANAVLLFALNARALCSVSKFGSSPEPPQGEREAPLSKGAGCVSGLGDSDGLCVAAHSRAISVQCKGAGCRPPLPLSFATHSQQSVGAGHARPATLLCPVNELNPSGLLRGHLP